MSSYTTVILLASACLLAHAALVSAASAADLIFKPLHANPTKRAAGDEATDPALSLRTFASRKSREINPLIANLLNHVGISGANLAEDLLPPGSPPQVERRPLDGPQDGLQGGPQSGPQSGPQGGPQEGAAPRQRRTLPPNVAQEVDRLIQMKAGE